MNHTNNFNLLRLLAASQVMVSHMQTHLGVRLDSTILWFHSMFPGVIVFFLISGFLVGHSMKESDGLVDFARRRALRIYPGLWGNFIFVLVLLYAGGGFTLASLGTLRFWEFQFWQFLLGSDFYGSLFVGTVYDWGGFYKHYPSGVLWTINVELGFYLLLPLLFWSPRLVNAKLLVVFAASLMAAFLIADLRRSGASGNSVGILVNSPLPYFWMFLLGVAAQMHWERIRHFFEGKFFVWFSAYLFTACVLSYGYKTYSVIYSQMPWNVLIQIPLICGCVLSFAYSLKWLPVIRNDFSYGIYLYHMQVVSTLLLLGFKGQWWLWLAVPAATTVLAALSWFLIERPALLLKRRAPKQVAHSLTGATG
jgi:peptidoglycan/LPS O-acetylase OafA/YrhL